MNKPGATVADDFEVLPPVDGTVSAQLVAAGEPTELGKQVGALLAISLLFFNTACARDPPEKGDFGRGGQQSAWGNKNRRYSGY